MFLQKVAVLMLLPACHAFAQTPTGWKVVKDKTNACQISIPPDWKPSAAPGSADAPNNQGDLSVASQPGKTVKPYNEMTQKVLMVAKMIHNTAQSVFYASEPTKSDNPITPYHAIVPASGGICSVILSVRKGVSEEMATKIVDTLSPVK